MPLLAGRRYCDGTAPLTLARSQTGSATLQFENEIELYSSFAPELRDGLLRLRTRLSSADETLLSRYSLALHVIDTLTGERVAQEIPASARVMLSRYAGKSTSARAEGEYEVRVALYDWQTGERLIARDLETGADGDMHTLHHFRLG